MKSPAIRKISKEGRRVSFAMDDGEVTPKAESTSAPMNGHMTNGVSSKKRRESIPEETKESGRQQKGRNLMDNFKGIICRNYFIWKQKYLINLATTL
jgi:hypothetical protein